MKPRIEMENESNKRYPDFFKVYLPARNSHRLHIPDGYEEGCGRTLPKKVMLINHMGKCWHVDVAHTEKLVHFLNGWNKFVQDNSLQHGDFLVFRYDGNSGFYVKNLGQVETENSTRGANGTLYLNQVHLEQYEEKEEEQEDNDDHDHDHDDNDENRDHNEEDEDKAEEEEDDDDDYDDEATTTKRRNQTGGIYGGSKKRAVAKKGGGSKKSYDFVVEEEAPIVRKNKDQKKRSDNKGSKKKSVAKGRGFERTQVISEQIDVSNHIQPLNVHFFAKLRGGPRNHLLLVPSQVLKQHKMDLPHLVIFQNEQGRQWPGHTLYWGDGRTWISGWGAFCKWNNVGLDDWCLCEFLPGCNGQKGDTIKVHIIRNAGSGS